MKQQFLIVFLITILIIGLTTGCSLNNHSYDSTRPTLEITQMVQSIGAADGHEKNYDIQKFSYSLTLINNDKEEIYVKEVHVALPSQFEKRVTTKNYTINVDKVLAPNSYIEIENFHEFNAKGLSKQDIDNLNPSIQSLKITSEKTIDIENRIK